MDKKAFQEAIDQLAKAKNISRETVLKAFTEALEQSFLAKSVQRGIKEGGDDARVEAKIDEENGIITLAQIKRVSKDVQDDYLEIEPDEAKKYCDDLIERLNEECAALSPKKDAALRADLKALAKIVSAERKTIKVGKDVRLYAPLSEVSKAVANSARSTLHSKINEEERYALYDQFKDRIGEMINGEVVKSDDRITTVNIGHGVEVELGKNERIGNETFTAGDKIKVYVQEVRPQGEDGSSRGPQIQITRTSEGFLRCLFDQEISEIHDGTVLIKGCAREAGLRSKVAVYSTSDNVDAVGSCIGQHGSRIQKVAQHLGNGLGPTGGRDNALLQREKIDIIPWSENEALYIAESLRPTKVVGVAIMDTERKERDPATNPGGKPRPFAIIVIKDGDEKSALGVRHSNIRLAMKLTDWYLELREESKAIAEGIDYKTVDELKREAEAEKLERERQEFARKTAKEVENRQAQKAVKGASYVDIAPEFGDDDDLIEETHLSDTKPSIVDNEPLPEPKPAKPVQPVEVKATTTLEALERGLEESAKKKETSKRTYKKKAEKAKEEKGNKDEESVKKTPENMLPIYSEEEQAELDAIEAEEAEETSDYGEEEDYSEYDQYYDE